MSCCSVCNTALGDGREIMATTCGHRFHSHCISFFVRRLNKCPECDTDITQADIHRVHLDPPNGAERNSPRNEGNTNELVNNQIEIVRLLREMQSSNNRRHLELDRRDDNYRPNGNHANPVQNPGMINHGQIINCDVYRPVSFDFNLNIQPPQMPFMQFPNIPALRSGPTPLALPAPRQ